MRYAVLLHQDEQVWAGADEATQQAVMTAHEDFARAVADHPEADVLAGEALHGVAQATSVRHVGGRRVLTDGPYAETAEQMGGFYVVRAPDLDTLLELLERLPHDYGLEIRPVADV